RMPPGKARPSWMSRQSWTLGTRLSWPATTSACAHSTPRSPFSVGAAVPTPATCRPSRTRASPSQTRSPGYCVEARAGCIRGHNSGSVPLAADWGRGMSGRAEVMGGPEEGLAAALDQLRGVDIDEAAVRAHVMWPDHLRGAASDRGREGVPVRHFVWPPGPALYR